MLRGMRRVSLRARFDERYEDDGFPYFPWRMTRRLTGQTEGVKMRMKMKIVVRMRMVIVTFLTIERMFLFDS